MLLFTIILMDFLTGMEFDLFVPSFPELKDHFQLSSSWVEMSLTVNFIGYCIGLFVTSGIADRHGRKPMILLGLFIFILGSLLCLSASSYLVILVGRFFQGVGIAPPAILSFLIIADRYPMQKQQVLMSILNGSKNMAVAFAPVLGSLIADHFHWQGNFATLLMLGMMTFLLTLLFVPYYKPVHSTTLSMWNVYRAIFKSKSIVLLLVYFILMFVPYWVFVGISPLLYMKDLGVSLSQFGFYQGSLALTFALGSLLFGFIVTKYDQKKMLSFGNQIFIVSLMSIMLVTLVNGQHPLFITLAFIPFIIGQIIPSNILFPMYLHLMPDAKGKLTAIVQEGQLIFASLGLQIAGYFYAGTFRSVGLIISFYIAVGIVVMTFVLKQWRLISRPALSGSI